MKKMKYLLLLVGITLGFAACSKKESFDQEAQFKTDTVAIRKFVTENNIAGIKEEKTGIFYQIIAPGSGDVAYSKSTSITADYEGRLLTGAVFDGSKGKPITFQLGGVISGWQIAIPLIQKGGKIRFILPSLYAYGNSGSGPIAPNSILDFTVTLTDLK